MPVAPASLDLAPANAYSTDLAEVVRVFGPLNDFFLSPSHDVLLIAQNKKIVFTDVLGKKMGPALPFEARVVSAEWLLGDRVAEATKLITK